MRNLEEKRCTLSGLSNRDVALDPEEYLPSKISNVLARTMPHLRDGIKEGNDVSDLKALFIGLSQKQKFVGVYFIEGVRWAVKSFQFPEQAINAIGSEKFEFIFISIRYSDHFGPSIASRIRTMKNTLAPKIIAFDNYVPKYLNEKLIRSGVDKVVISDRF